MSRLQAPMQGALLALLGFALFSTHDALVKTLGASYAPFQILFFSVLFGMPLVLLMLIGDSERGTLRPKNLKWVLVRSLLGVTVGLAAFTAFTRLPLAQVYAIIFAQPLLITALSVPVLGEKVGPTRWAAVAIGLIGVLIVIRPGSEPLGIGHLAALIASLGGAGVAVILRKIGKEERSAVLIIYPMLGNLLISGAALGVVYQPMPFQHLVFAAGISVCGFLAMLSIISAYRRAEAATVAPMMYSQIVWAALYGALIFDEYPDLWTGVGAGVIIVSGLVIVIREQTGGRTRHKPVTTPRSTRGDMVPGLRADAILRRERD